MKRLLVGAMALAAAMPAQVATQANTNYKTEEGRKSVANNLGGPDRDERQKPGELVRGMGLQAGMTVADIGTGIGYMLPTLSRRVGPSGKVIAEDIFDDFLAAAKQRAENQKLDNVTFIKGTDADPKLPAGALDMALVLDVYHHFDYPEKMLAAIYQALKPDGRLVIVEYYKRSGAMGRGNAEQHIRLDMPDVIKEVEANRYHLMSERETIPDSQYMLVLRKK